MEKPHVSYRLEHMSASDTYLENCSARKLRIMLYYKVQNDAVA
jgi:hypothetical protein